MLCGNLPLEFSHAPATFDCLFCIIGACISVKDLNQMANVRPAQFVAHCVTNWEREIELPHPPKI